MQEQCGKGFLAKMLHIHSKLSEQNLCYERNYLLKKHHPNIPDVFGANGNYKQHQKL